MFFPITLDSRDDGAMQNNMRTHLRYQFKNPITLDKRFWWHLLPTAINYPNTLQNISSTIGNNSLRYSLDSGVNYSSITIGNGSYGTDSIANALRAGLIDNGHFYDPNSSGDATGFTYPFVLRFNNALNKSYFEVNTLAANWDASTTIIDLTNNSTSTLYTLLGFLVGSAVLNTGANYYYSDGDPDFLGINSTLFFQLYGLDISNQTNSPFKSTFFLGKFGIGGTAQEYDATQLLSYRTSIFSERISFIEVRIVNQLGELMELTGTSEESNVEIRLTLVGIEKLHY